MGHIWVEVEISNLDKTKNKRIKGIVDTGATLTTLPRTLAEELGIQVFSKDQVETGSGCIYIEKGRAIISIGKKEDIQTVRISDIIDKVLIGCVTMETLGLKANPLTGKIEEAPLMLYLKTYKVKK